MKWFRLYSDAVDDEKLRLLAFEDRWHFVALMCCKSSGLIDAEQPHDLLLRKLAVKLGLQIREVEEVQRRLMDVGLIDAGFNPVAWEKRQYKHDDSSERVRRYREKKKAVTECNGDVTVTETVTQPPETVSVTSTDTDTDTDTEVGTDVPLSESKIPPCPHLQIIRLYHAELPELPSILESSWSRSKEADALRARWNEDSRHQDVEFWRDLFGVVRSNPHWMGNNDRGWRASLRWLVKKENFIKVCEWGVNHG